MTQTDEAIATNVKRLREARGLSQTELAELYGCRQPYIAQIERGERGTGPVAWKKLAQALGIKLEDLWAPPPAEVNRAAV